MVSVGADAAKLTAKRVMKWKTVIDEAAKAESVPSSIVAAIYSRETAALDVYTYPPPKGSLGDKGFGHGPLQVDKRSFPAWCALWATGQLKVEEGFKMGAKVLRMKLDECRKLWPEEKEDVLLERAVAGYNCGVGNVKKALKNGRAPDAYTTGKNYSTDTMARAKWFRENGFES